MKQSLSLALAIGCLAVAGTAMAYPSLAGPPGTGVLPTAAVAGYGQLQVAADIYGAQQVSDPYSADSAGIWRRQKYGGWRWALPPAIRPAWNLNGKISYPLDQSWRRGLALGARYAVHRYGRCSTGTPISSTASPRRIFIPARTYLRGSVGLNWTDHSFRGMKNTENAFRPFVSVNFRLPNRVNLVHRLPIPQQ